jgi:hypothetical protein
MTVRRIAAGRAPIVSALTQLAGTKLSVLEVSPGWWPASHPD